MAVQKHSILAAMVVLWLAIKMASSSQPAPAPAPALASPIPNVNSTGQPPKLTPPEELFMRTCSKHPVTEECGKSIWKSVFNRSRDDFPSSDCCHQLYDFGIECHTGLIEVMISAPLFEGNKDQIRQNSQHIVRNCGFVFGGGK